MEIIIKKIRSKQIIFKCAHFFKYLLMIAYRRFKACENEKKNKSFFFFSLFIWLVFQEELNKIIFIPGCGENKYRLIDRSFNINLTHGRI